VPAAAPQVPPPPPPAPEPIRWTQVRPRHLLPSLVFIACCVPTRPVQPGFVRPGSRSSVFLRVSAEVLSVIASMFRGGKRQVHNLQHHTEANKGVLAASVTLGRSAPQSPFSETAIPQ